MLTANTGHHLTDLRDCPKSNQNLVGKAMSEQRFLTLFLVCGVQWLNLMYPSALAMSSGLKDLRPNVSLLCWFACEVRWA